MPSVRLPYEPIRDILYSPKELFEGFDPEVKRSFAETRDFAIYRYFVLAGGLNPFDAYPAMMQSLHDNSITQALRQLLAERKCVGIMGGHDLKRNDSAYSNVAHLARRLAGSSFLVASGGGPGAMEAAHFGARFHALSDHDFSKALRRLSVEPDLPKLKAIVRPDGSVDYSLVEAAHRWFRPAFELTTDTPAGAQSLAVPTWLYGHEPSTPFASDIAKYFQNSIREAGLLAIATYGVVFAEGSAGTLQEIFQDAAQNHYRSLGFFSPMVFLGVDYWSNRLPARALLKAELHPDDFDRFLLFTDSFEEAEHFLNRFELPRTLADGYAALVASARRL